MGKLRSTSCKPHRISLDRLLKVASLPVMETPRRLSVAMFRLRSLPDGPAKRTILQAFTSIAPATNDPSTAPSSTTGSEAIGQSELALIHGDWHPGQVVLSKTSLPCSQSRWRFVDIDDLALGHPAWDLARPAAWFAAGLLPPDDWMRFLSAYLMAEGPALPKEGDPWQILNEPAKSLVVQCAAMALAHATAAGRALEDTEESLIECCDRLCRLNRRS